MPNTVVEPAWIHVVAAVIWDSGDRILLARRPSHKHQGDKWEFPGGKVEQGEVAQVALARELAEELGLLAMPEAFYPFIQVRHCYTDKAIFLDVWSVRDFKGKPRGLEGQEIQWFTVSALTDLVFPEANLPILNKLKTVAQASKSGIS